VAQSIHEYLQSLTETSIDYNYIEKKLKEALDKKQFVMWNGTQFCLGKIKEDAFTLKREFTLKKDKHGKYFHTIIITDKKLETEWHFLLRWRNGKGILNPAWQIKMQHTDNVAKLAQELGSLSLSY
jgi:uncharacterized protein YegP (UPF0339 family)